ncbi:hypothetical protein BXE85_15410 [Salmonella enterica subsp. enterica]|nr:hypothetical protein [Salmonella enterica subsp. enterica serovar Cairina]EDT2939709.1 hypothetical protein [Salmonella enterica subsp. enterica]
MDNEVTFSLSFEQLLQETEDQIKKCDLREAGPYYLQELNKARDFLAFWHRLALKGQAGTPDARSYERIDADWEPLDALIRNGSCAT